MSRISVSLLVSAILVSLASLGSSANAQFVNRSAARWYGGAAVYGAGIDYGLGYGGGTTAAEGYQRGMADVIRAQGEYAESAARAAKDREEARSRYIENQTLWMEEYNRRKRTGLAQRNAEQAERREAVNRYRAARDAKRSEVPAATQLDPDTGEILWPEALRQREFRSARERLEALFQDREETGGSTAMADDVRELVYQMRKTLQARIREYSANDFIAADKFLNALANAGSAAG